MNPCSGNKPITLSQGDVACVPARLAGAAFQFPTRVRSNPLLRITRTARPPWPTLLFTVLLGLVFLGGRLQAGEATPTLSLFPSTQQGEDRLHGWRNAEFAPVYLDSPLDYQVVQRQADGQGTVRLTGFASGRIQRLEMRFTGQSRTGQLPGDWRPIDCDREQGRIDASILLPEGGWYACELRAYDPEGKVVTLLVPHVGVGEVFVVAGQSNSANHGSERQRVETGLVAAFNGQGWQIANDPQPGASGDGGSFLPAFGDALASRLKLPIGLVSVGVGATSVREWLPQGARMTNQPTTGAHVKAVGPHEWESTGELFQRLAGALSRLGPQGCRAVLWHQGESDAGQARAGYPADRQITGEQYRGFMEQVIQASRQSAGWDVPWCIAQATYHSEQDAADPEFRAAQAALWTHGIAGQGPDTDALRAPYRDGVHFNALGLQHHGRLWAEKIMSWMSSPRPVPTSQVMPGAGDYTFLSWSDGWLNGAPRRPGLICLQTGQYGAVFDPWHATWTHLGKVATPSTYEVAGALGTEELFHLPQAELNLQVHADGGIYRCIRAATNTADWLNFPVRIIESGRYLQHWDIQQLHFEDDQGNVLPAISRLDMVAWPDKIHLTLEVIPSKDLAAMEVKLQMKSAAFGNQESVSSAEKAPTGSRVLASLLVSPSPAPPVLAGRWQAKEVITGQVVPMEMSREWQALRVLLPSPDWSVAREPDRLERYALELDNPADAPQTCHLVFDSTNGTPGITGVTAMLRDAEGYPTGIPVQMSKNWHRQSGRRFLYEGPWLHAATLLHLPPRSKVSLELALCWARWGGVPAASHAQLCLVGWGWNQQWDEVAIGSWGESICYEPEAIQQRCRIDDVRPLMVWGMNGKEQRWTWTHNVGGGDFLVYYDAQNQYQPWRGVRTAYLSQGPNLTDVLYSGITADGAIACQVRVSTPRCDDINRAYHRIRYDVLKPTAFRRLAFYQLGSDNYHWHQYGLLARGNTGGMIEEWNPGRGGTRYLRADIPCQGEAPWFSLHAAVPQDNSKPVVGAWATRGLIIRSWKARLGGREAPAVAAVYGTEAGRIPSANLELAPPTNITRLEPGDFVEAEVELVILPHSAEDYYGPNQNLKVSLAGTANTWKPVLRQAKGNQVQLNVRSGHILRTYPPVLAVDQDELLDFDITGGCGYLPITVTGLKDYRGYELLSRDKSELTVIDQSVHGQDFWQTDWDAATKQWRRTYNVSLDSPGDTAQTKGFVFRKGP